MCEERGPSKYGQRVKQRREERNWGIAELGEYADVHWSTISKLEAGVIQTTTLRVAIKIARALGTDLAWLVGMYDDSASGEFPTVSVAIAGN